MAEMDGLKKRVELVDLRLKSAHSAREKESAALMDTWEQIRDRFQEQRAEIVKLRSRISEHEDSRDDLLKMVHSLLEAVESGLDSMADETVPRIKDLAGQLMANNKEDGQLPGASTQSTGSDTESETPATLSTGANFHQELLTRIEQSIESANKDDYVNGEPPSVEAEVSTETDKNLPASPGIRNLVARIENAVGEEFFEPSSAADDKNEDDEDDLSRDLREIEALRYELNGLRHRISAGAA